MKLIAALLFLATSESVLARTRLNEVLKNLLDITYKENKDGVVFGTAYGNLIINYRKQPRAVLKNGPHSFRYYQGNNSAHITLYPTNIVNTLFGFNEFETRKSKLDLT